MRLGDGSRLCYECRCGGEFELSDDELRGGIDIVPCDSCSLRAPASMNADRRSDGVAGGIRGERRPSYAGTTERRPSRLHARHIRLVKT
jgi:hypothetical protein